jgi:hypothetical protein
MCLTNQNSDSQQDRPVGGADYMRFMAGSEIPGADAIPGDLLRDIAVLVGRGTDSFVSPEACKEAVALLAWLWRADFSVSSRF